MRKSTAILTAAVCFFFGIVLGFLISPIKNGISVGNNSGNTKGNNNGNNNGCISKKGKFDDEDLLDEIPF